MLVQLRFPGRYQYAEELKKMGLNYNIKDQMLIINGGNQLKGCKVKATDLRGGIALLIAGMCAKNTTTISNAWQILRGYNEIEEKLNSMGANVSFINEGI